MAEAKAKQEEQEQELTGTELARSEVAPLAPISENALDYGNAALMADLQSEINTALKGISVGKFTPPSTILDRLLTLTDAFPFSIMETTTQGKVEKPLCVFVCTDQETGEVLFVPQSRNSIRDRFITIYEKIEARNSITGTKTKVAVTNVKFQELTNLRAIAGNYPIGLQLTPESKIIETAG